MNRRYIRRLMQDIYSERINQSRCIVMSILERCFIFDSPSQSMLVMLKPKSAADDQKQVVRKNFVNSNSNRFGKLVDLPNGKMAIGTKWVFRNKKDKRGIVIRNKASHSYMEPLRKRIYVTQPPELKIRHQTKVVQVQQKEDGIFISQDKYVAEILKKFNYTDVKSASTLVDLEKPLVKDRDADDVDVHLYRSMIGFLMYLTTSIPEYLTIAVMCMCRFQVTPKISHLLAIKRIFRYLKGKPTLGLWLISWQCKKQLWLPPLQLKLDMWLLAICRGKSLTKGYNAGRFQYLSQDKQIEYLMLNASPLKYCLRGGYLCQYAVKHG
ncbi:hypothetical protein Tco_1577730 [Tanacetum coccineum]